ncbi:FAD:protein FMN transferase [Pseudoteredinibacter isoporae]
MGTYVDVSIEADLDDEQLLDLSIDAFEAITRVHDTLGFHNPDSELSDVNRWAQSGSAEPIAISEDLRRVMELALNLSAASDGLFDVTVAPRLVQQGSLPHVHRDAILSGAGNWQDVTLSDEGLSFRAPVLIDLGGIAKGYAVDQAIARIAANKMHVDINVNVNAGGDLYLSNWQEECVGVRYPDELNRHYDMPMLAPALATSACYFSEQDSVMIHPGSGEALVRGYSVSVFAEHCMLADALTKLAFLNPGDSSVVRQFNGRAFLLDSQNGLLEL